MLILLNSEINLGVCHDTYDQLLDVAALERESQIYLENICMPYIYQGSFCHVNLSANQFFKIPFIFFKLNFCSCLRFSKTYNSSVFFKNGLKLYVIESLNLKYKF